MDLPLAIPLSRDITDANNDFLTKDVSGQEIMDTIKQINCLKAPGLDSMQTIFYQNNWDILGSPYVKWSDLFVIWAKIE